MCLLRLKVLMNQQISGDIPNLSAIKNGGHNNRRNKLLIPIPVINLRGKTPCK